MSAFPVKLLPLTPRSEDVVLQSAGGRHTRGGAAAPHRPGGVSPATRCRRPGTAGVTVVIARFGVDGDDGVLVHRAPPSGRGLVLCTLFYRRIFRCVTEQPATNECREAYLGTLSR